MPGTNKTPIHSSRSQEMDDITRKPPHWMVNRGSALLLIVFLLTTAASYFIPYPNTITTDIRFSYPTEGTLSARFLIPDQKAKDILPSQKINIHFLSPQGLYPEFTTGRIIQMSTSTEPGFSVAHIAFANSLPRERFKFVITKNDSTAKAVITAGSAPLLFVLFQKTSPSSK